MNPVKFVPVAFLLLAWLAPAQQQGPTPNHDKPDIILQNNRPKNAKDSNTRIIDGTVKDASDNPMPDAIVQLKNTKTSDIVSFSTKDDGKYVFRELPMDIDYELLAKHGNVATPAKKVSVYDTRKHVILNFQLAAAK